ncbi:MAG: Na+/H+ antiporter NhaA [Pyrinomonadaceae bacterium]
MIRKLANLGSNRGNRVKLTKAFKEFFENEKSAGISLVICSVISMIIANSAMSESYLGFWEEYIGGLSISHWVNDGLMAIFFLLIGCELKRELYEGELSNLRNALLPIFAAVGGVAIPAIIHFSLNAGLPTQAGIGIPMATDIAFALGILALAGDRVPGSLKIFLTALAVIDDLIAIIVIAVFYTSTFSLLFLLLALSVFGILMIFNRLKFNSLFIYLILGAVMWFFMLKSGVHATIAGVLLAFTIPYTPETDDEDPLNVLEHHLHKPVAFFILPIFALANTGIIIGANWAEELTTSNSLGIMLGLFFGKLIGVTSLSFIAVKLNLCRLPSSLKWRHIVGAGLLGGIGFTMAIFITNLAFAGNSVLINDSKMAVLLTSLCAGIAGYLWLILFSGKHTDQDTLETMRFDVTVSPDR